MSSSDGLFVIVDSPIEYWCERRALGPLGCILQAYPLASGLMDEWQGLYQALRLIRSHYDAQLPRDEADQLGEAIVLVGQRLFPKITIRRLPLKERNYAQVSDDSSR